MTLQRTLPGISWRFFSYQRIFLIEWIGMYNWRLIHVVSIFSSSFSFFSLLQRDIFGDFYFS